MRYAIPITFAVIGLFTTTQVFAKSMNYDTKICGNPLFYFYGKPVFNPVFYFLSMFKYIYHEQFVPYYLNSIVYFLYFGIAALLIAIIWTMIINYIKNHEGNWHGTARFAGKRDLKKNGLLKKEGIVCGQTNDAIVKVDKYDSAVHLKSVHEGTLICHSGKMHTLLLGPSGEGKSFVIIPTIWNFKGHQIIFDPKSENFNITSREKSRYSRVIRFGPTKEDSAHYNPVEDCMREGLAYAFRDSDQMANILFAPAKESSTGSENGEYFTQSGKSFVTAALMHIRYSDYPEKNLGGIRDFFANGNESELEALMQGKGEASGALGVSQVKEMMATKHYFIINENMYKRNKAKFDKLGLKVGDKYYDPELQKLVLKGASDIMQTNAKEKASVWKTIATKIRDFDDPNIRTNMGSCDFSIQDFIDSTEPICLYLCVPNSDVDRISAVFRLFITSILMRLTENDSSFGKAELKIPLLLLLDEFPILGTFSILAKEMGILRSYNVFVMIVCQSLNQIVDRYGQHHPFLDHCSCHIVYAPGEVHDAEYFSKRMGNETVHQSKISRSGGIKIASDNNVNYSDNDFSRPLMDSADIQRLPSNQALIMVRGMQPYIAKKIPYYQDSRFKHLMGEALSWDEVFADVAGLPSQVRKRQKAKENLEKLEKTPAVYMTGDDSAVYNELYTSSEDMELAEEAYNEFHNLDYNDFYSAAPKDINYQVADNTGNSNKISENLNNDSDEEEYEYNSESEDEESTEGIF